MDIAVVGSFQPTEGDESATRSPKVFTEACRAIGKALGEGRHRLWVAHRKNIQTESLQSAESLALRGFLETQNCDHFVEVAHHVGDPQLKAHTEAVERSEAVILIGGKEGTYAAGLSALLRRKMIITIPAFGGSARDLCEIAEIDRTVIDELRNLDANKPNWINTLTNAIATEINSYPRILIVHGRGDDGRELRQKVREVGRDSPSLRGLAEPLIMDLSGRGALSVPEVFEKFASRVSATIAIVTADDVGGFARRDRRGEEYISDDSEWDGELPATELVLAPRARENVWVEVGWFWGRLGRRRIFLWLKDDVPLPSDLQGAAWSRGSINKAWPEIQDFIVTLREGESELRPRYYDATNTNETRGNSTTS